MLNIIGYKKIKKILDTCKDTHTHAHMHMKINTFMSIEVFHLLEILTEIVLHTPYVHCLGLLHSLLHQENPIVEIE